MALPHPGQPAYHSKRRSDRVRENITYLETHKASTANPHTVTLDQACDEGAVTDQSISIENLTLNQDASDDDAVITFNQPTEGFRTLRWDKGVHRFEFSEKLFVGGAVYCQQVYATGLIQTTGSVLADGNLNLNYNGPDGDSFIYFYDSGTSFGEYLKWDDGDDRFEFSDDLYIDGDLTAISGEFSRSVTVDEHIYAEDIQVQGGTKKARLWTDDTYIHLTDPVYGVAAIRIWANSKNVYFSNDILVGASIHGDGNLYLNDDESVNDIEIHFGKVGVDPIFKYDLGNARFEFSDDIWTGNKLQMGAAGEFEYDGDNSEVTVEPRLSGDFRAAVYEDLPGAPVKGQIAFHDSSGEFFGYNGAAWRQLS